MHNIHDIREILHELKAKLFNLYGNTLKQIIVYGSYARNEAAEHSDIDLVIVLEGKIVPGREIDRMIEIISDLNIKHGVLISVYPVSETDYETVNSPLLLNVRKEGVAA
ncbi:MAG TPA: nucleotidyltransferase domain-containing protein [Nitrospirae bacterium]|nr:nucleotidyltransferase domain protein [bacterium BMS3Abin06]HDH10898.1 nucleotidyltransferase domain-containing protein [Nitrospirota bacterium]HDZ02687.1 nucleotidyltransferase domain-containing protein [Nitrospirota bacterium]